jgi:Concanavalin A-like lectin/glucanases superfamily
VRIDATMDVGRSQRILPASAGGAALKWPVTLLATLPSDAGHVSFTVVALHDGSTVGNGALTTVAVPSHHVIDGDITLDHDTMPIDDGGLPLDGMGQPDLSTTTAPPDLAPVVIVPGAYSRTLTVPKGMVSSSTGLAALDDYPLLVSISSPTLNSVANGGHVAKDDGSDLRFTATGATCNGPPTCILDHEIELYNPTSGVLVAWVRVPALGTAAATNDTVLTLYYGNATPPGTPTAAKVWDGSFRGVWHLDSVNDSTSAGHNGVATGATAATGLIVNGFAFNGTSDYVEIADSPALDVGTGADFTLSLWARSSQSAVGPRLVSKRDTSNASPGYELLLHSTDPNGPWLAQLDSAGGNDSVNGRTNVSDGNWHLLTVVRQGTKLHAFEDTAEGTPTNLTAANDLSNALALRFGAAADSTVGQFFNGSEDEVRLSSTARSADWILTDFASQKAGSTLVQMGAEIPPAP